MNFHLCKMCAWTKDRRQYSQPFTSPGSASNVGLQIQMLTVLCHFTQGIEHPRTVVSVRVLELIPRRYRGTTVLTNEHYGKGGKICGLIITLFI